MAFGINIRASSGGSRATAMTNIISKITKKLEADVDRIGKDIQKDLRDNETPYRKPAKRGKAKGTKHTATYWEYKDKAKGFNVSNNRPWIGTLNEGRWVSSSKSGKGPSKKRNWVQASVKKNTK